ncbi:signal peptide-containing protein [Cryptosporidium canis]|uniref:Signal peptide-containing protein n=1 Tax=Cryptosporidium canis TaxID=195482 RepID=A0A9D5HWH3_9CRYT|nr:signal peptide-containing protein [Cryptosporidium canis]
MIYHPFKVGRLAVCGLLALFILLKHRVNAIDQLDLILCGKKGNQYYVTSTPFITKGAYLYADLLIKIIDGPWPVKPNGVAYTLEEYKLEVVRKVILSSPQRLRNEISNATPTKNHPWTEIMDRMTNYPPVLRIINDIRFSVFLCGPEMLDSPILTKFIKRTNSRFGHNFNPFSDKIITAALKMHGVKESTVQKKLALTEHKSLPKEQDAKGIHSAPALPEPVQSKEEGPEADSKLAAYQKPPLILNESEFDEFKDEKSFESDYSKTPPFGDEEQKPASASKSSDSQNAYPELPETLFVAKDASSSPPSSLELPDISDIRVSRINNAEKYALNLGVEASGSANEYESMQNGTPSNLKDDNLLQEDIGDIDLSRKYDGDEKITIRTSADSLTGGLPHGLSPTLGEHDAETAKVMAPEYSSSGSISPPADHKPQGISIPQFEHPLESVELEEDAQNYKEQGDVDSKLGETDLENIQYDDIDEDYDDIDDDEYDEFTSEEEYNQYLDYRDHYLRNKEEAEKEMLNKPKEVERMSASYPLGKSKSAPKALLQDVSSVFTDLLNAVKANKISDSSIAFGIPSINLKLNARSKAIVFGDRIIKKWKAQSIDGVLKSIPIFHHGSFEELSAPSGGPDLASNSTKKESTFIEVDFNSAIRSHDKNEGGYVWTQRNLIATRTTAGFQDILIKAALKGLNALTSIQCSAILEMPVASSEVNECIFAYFSSINFGQNKVYGALTEEDEEKSIRGFEVSKAFSTQQPAQKQELPQKQQEEEPVSEEVDEDDLIIRSHLKSSTEGQKSPKMYERQAAEFDAVDNLIRKHLEKTPSNTRPVAVEEAGPINLIAMPSKERKSQFSENSEDITEDLTEEPTTYYIKNATISKPLPHKAPVIGPNTVPSSPERFYLGPPAAQMKPISELNTLEPVEISPKEEMPTRVESKVIPNKYIDPEFIEKELEKLALNATDAYKRIYMEFKIPASDLEPTVKAYNQFLDTLEIWSAVAGEALIFTGKKMSGLHVTKKNKLTYFYSREEFYVYQAIFNYSINLVASLSSFLQLKKNLENVKELLKESFATTVKYESISTLAQKMDAILLRFNNVYGHNLQLFCNGMPITECLGIMKNDFYRRNEKFVNYIARNSDLKKATAQILELFNISIPSKGITTNYQGSRDDINRYILSKDFIVNQVPIFTKKFNNKLLKEQLAIDQSHAEFVIKALLDKHGLSSKRSSCGDVKWERKSKKNTNLKRKSKKKN